MALAAVATGREAEYLRVVELVEPPGPWDSAGRAYVANEPDALERIERLSKPEAAVARLQLAQSGRRDVDALLGPAIEFWRSVGAVGQFRRAEPLLSKSA